MGSESNSPNDTILVVDDEDLVREFAAHLLERHGFEVIAAASGDEAVALFEQDPGRIDAVLLDMTMPGLSGEQTSERLRQRVPELPLVLTSGFEARHRPTDARVAFVQKPYTADVILGELRRVMA